jgi:flagellar hook assembly protein FlgD
LLQASLAAITTSVEKSDANIPGSFTLGQNYPNPFNPTTTISFSLPQRSNVRLDIYDILGKQVATLINETRAAGNWNIEWNGLDRYGRHIASGVYFYRLEAGSFMSVKKMVMLK